SVFLPLVHRGLQRIRLGRRVFAFFPPARVYNPPQREPRSSTLLPQAGRAAPSKENSYETLIPSLGRVSAALPVPGLARTLFPTEAPGKAKRRGCLCGANAVGRH